MLITVTQTIKNLITSVLIVLLTICLVPLLRSVSPIITIGGIPFYIAYLPISLFIAIACVFGFRIFPALLLGILISYINELHLNTIQTVGLSLSVTVPLLVSLFILKKRLGNRYRANITNRKGVLDRLLCLGLLYPILMQFSLYFWGMFTKINDDFQYYFSIKEITLLLLNLQSLTLPAVVFTAFFYHILRTVVSFNYARKFYINHISTFFQNQNRRQVTIWLISLAILIAASTSQSVAMSGYGIPAIFLIFVYGFISLDPTVITCLWSIVVYLFIQHNSGFIKQLEQDQLFICFSALFIVFTIANIWLSSMKIRLNKAIIRLSAMARRDPLTHLPNLQALAYDIKHTHAEPCLCYIRLFAIDKIEKHLGFTFKSTIKIALYSQLKRLLGPEAKIYAAPNRDVLILLPEENIRARLQRLITDLNLVKLTSQDEKVDIHYGISWKKMSPGDDVYQTICGLEYLATIKRRNHVSALHEHDKLVEKYTMLDIIKLNGIKQAILGGGIIIYAQKIDSIDGSHCYYEVLCRLSCEGKVMAPHEFLPLIAEFDLCSLLDFRILDCFLEQYCQHVLSHTDSVRYSINIMPETLGDEKTADKIIATFQKFGVSSRNFIFEVTEEQLFFNKHVALANIKRLRNAGFTIAIDDFGKGYANYERLKMLDADVIKIDGMFVKDITHNHLDAVIVKSIIDIARAKNMKVVAEFVETKKHALLLKNLGVDYLQGYYIGKPEPLKFSFG
jgi:EAL domain-containing protein (putative c-di-GMP-specific phosphodiesterase class I)/GGDEF domain-containing protein